MGWLAILRTLLTLASAIAGIIRDKRLLDAGTKEELARGLAELASRAGIAQAVHAKTAALTDSDLDAALRGNDT